MSNAYQYDVLILGSGAAGLSLALRLREDISVAVVSKRALHEGSTYYAQGGISAVLGPNDSMDSHIQDTLRAGGALCDPEVVRLVVEKGPPAIHWLLEQQGWHVSLKRVKRIWRREGLKVPNKQPKRGRLWLNDGSCVRLRPVYKNHVWSYDFVQDRTHDGKAF